jgi:hypothetical protein
MTGLQVLELILVVVAIVLAIAAGAIVNPPSAMLNIRLLSLAAICVAVAIIVSLSPAF